MVKGVEPVRMEKTSTPKRKKIEVKVEIEVLVLVGGRVELPVRRLSTYG